MDPYQVLGIPASSSTDELEARYRFLLRRYHPDVHHLDGPRGVAEAEYATRLLNEAMAQIRRERATAPAPPRAGPGAAAGPAAGSGAGAGTGTGPGAGPGAGPDAGPGAGRGAWPGPGAAAGRGPGTAGRTTADADAGAQNGTGPDRRVHARPREPRPGPGPSADEAAPGAADAPWWAGPQKTGSPCPFCGEHFADYAAYDEHLREAHRFRIGSSDRRRRLPVTIGRGVADALLVMAILLASVAVLWLSTRIQINAVLWFVIWLAIVAAFLPALLLRPRHRRR